MSHTRRDFLRQSGCAMLAAGGGLLAAGIRDFGLVNALAAQEGASGGDYKALVCIFLNGGNDGNNTVVPLDLSLIHISEPTRPY